jgi:hypothetical protein
MPDGTSSKAGKKAVRQIVSKTLIDNMAKEIAIFRWNSVARAPPYLRFQVAQPVQVASINATVIIYLTQA